MEEIIVWRMGVLVGIVIFATICYWITADLANGNDEKENKKLYEFIEKYFGKNFLKVFKLFI